MSAENNSDINLKNLGKAEGGGMPPPRVVIPKGRGKKRQPNMQRGGRISARRIGGPNLQQQFLNFKNAKLPKKKSSSSSQVLPEPMSLGKKGHSTLPRVQELGVSSMSSSTLTSSNIGRKSNSRLATANKHGNSRKSSNVSTANSNGNNGNSEVIIRYGELLKKAVVSHAWKKRFFILTEGHLFYYPETFDVPQEMAQIEQEAKGKISLALISDIAKDKGDSAVFHLLTPARTYKLKLEGESDVARHGASTWVASIRGAAENAKQQQQSGPMMMRQARGSFSSLKVDEMDEAMMQASQFKHPAKRLLDAETMYTKGPFQPASLDEYELWTPFDVSAWLYTVQMQLYSEDFYKQQVDGKVLKTMRNAQNAKDLGVAEEDVPRFLSAINKLRNL